MKRDERKRPTWIAPGLVMCATCGDTTPYGHADDHWLWNEPDRWTCPACEAKQAQATRREAAT